MLRNLKSTVAALALSALLPTVATAQTVLTMSSWVPPSHSLTVTLAAWGAEIEKATNGRVKFQMLPKAPAAAPGTFDAVKDGLVDVSYVTASYLPARHSLPKLPELPGGGATAEINSVAYWRIHEQPRDACVDVGAVRAHDVLHDRKTDTMPLHSFVATHTPLQHALDIFRFDAGAVIFNTK